LDTRGKRVRFIDEIKKGTPLATTFEVESFKEIYCPQGKTDKNENCACKC
jgi:hypothetical protein